MNALQKETGSRPDAQELETAMLAIGSRRKIFRTSRWAGQQYEQTVVAAWFADRPLDRTEEARLNPAAAGIFPMSCSSNDMKPPNARGAPTRTLPQGSGGQHYQQEPAGHLPAPLRRR